MDFSYTGGCGGGAPGFCAAAEQCPGAFVGTDTASGTPVNCQADNAGVSTRGRGLYGADRRLSLRFAEIVLAARVFSPCGSRDKGLGW